jgi:NAD(P)-dependent dehydrogenase (short-subunit alcohol dehydrogenase family)
MGKRFIGKVAIVTGAGQGMGRAVALAFAQEESAYITGATIDLNGGSLMM